MKRLLALAPLQIAQALVGLGAIAAFTRLMSAEEFGHYALALSASMLAHTLLFTWAEAAAFRFYSAARAEGRTGDHFATLAALALALGAATLVVTGGILLLAGLREDMFALAAFTAGAALFRFFTRIGRESDRAVLAVGRYAALETTYLLIGFAAGVALLVRFDLGAAAPFAGLLCAGILVALIDAPRWFAHAATRRADLARAASYASYGAPLALALAIDLGVQTIARFILANEAGAADVGVYAAAFGLARPLDLMFMAAGAAFAPLLLTTYEEKGAAAVRDPAHSAFVVLAAIGIPAAAGLALIAAPLSALLVGDTLSADAARVLPWLALAGLASGFNLYYLSEAFQLTRRTDLRALVMLAPGVMQLVLTASLAAEHGAIGAAVAAAAGAICGSVLLTAFGRRLIALPLPVGELARIGVATAIMAAAIAALPHFGAADLPLKIITGAVAYIVAGFIIDIAGVRTSLLNHAFRAITFAEPSHAR